MDTLIKRRLLKVLKSYFKINLGGKLMTKFVIKNKIQKSNNPFPIDTLSERLKKEKAIDMRNNYQVVDLEDGYVKVVPKDKNKLYE